MRKLRIGDYTVTRKTPDRIVPGKMIDIELPYLVKDSILNIMFNPALQLSSADLVRQNMLAVKIESCRDDVISLEEEEYQRIKRAFDTFKGFTRDSVELVDRVMNAVVVEAK